MKPKLGDLVEYRTPYSQDGNWGKVIEVSKVKCSKEIERMGKIIYKIEPLRRPELANQDIGQEYIVQVYRSVN